MRMVEGGAETAESGAASTYRPLVDLHPGLRTDDALRTVHRLLLTRIKFNEAGVREGTDGEFLHDFRVSTRRTRTALTQVKAAYPSDERRRFAEDFRWLAKATGPARDLEVFRAALGEYELSLEMEPGALGELSAWLGKHQAAARDDCRRALDSPRYAALIQDWEGFLELDGRLDTDPSTPKDAARPVDAVACERIDNAFRRIVRRSNGLTSESDASLFHRLRLDCKKLRYLLEFFGSLLPAVETQRALTALRAAQDSLGDMNDFDVQAGWTERFDPPGDVGPTLLAYLRARQEQERAVFMPRLEAFVGDANRADIARMLGRP